MSNIVRDSCDPGAIESYGVGKGHLVLHNAIHDVTQPPVLFHTPADRLVQVISLLFSDAQTHYSDVKFLSLSLTLSLSLFTLPLSLSLSLSLSLTHSLSPSPPLFLSLACGGAVHRQSDVRGQLVVSALTQPRS